MVEQVISKIYTPRQHILVAEVFSSGGAIYLRIKKSGKNVVEDISLDDLLAMVFNTINSKSA